MHTNPQEKYSLLLKNLNSEKKYEKSSKYIIYCDTNSTTKDFTKIMYILFKQDGFVCH